MRRRSVLVGMIALGGFALHACSDDTTTGPMRAAEPSPTAPELAVASNTWIVRAKMPSDWTDVAAATVTNAAGQPIVYAIGGLNPIWGNPQQTVSAYNAATNTWTSRQPLPVRLARTNGAGVINGKIYISGGCTDRQCLFPTSALYMYDPATNTWTMKRDIPAAPPREPYGEDRYPLGDGVTGVIGGKLYVVSGCFEADAPHGYFETCEPLFFRYNPATNNWVELPSPSTVVETSLYHPFLGGVIDGKFYVMGSMYSTRETWFAVYDPATNRWTKLTNGFASPREGAASAVLGSKLYVIGGSRYNASKDAMDTLAVTISYDPTTRLWTRRADLPGPRTDIAASRIFLNGKARIELVGGSRPGNNLQYTP
jgi:N-acetylneuraminic acid mutarotase